MADASKDPDQSMEDILQSIKRIIADEGDEAPPAPGSDVLELTDMLAEDAAVPEPAADPVDLHNLSIDDIMAAPISSLPQAPQPVVEAPVFHPEPAPVAAPVAEGEDKLMSDATLSASVAALQALAHTPAPLHSGTPAFRSGTTIEDLVIEALKPMLKEWLDGNLPAMVKALVEKEIRRLSA